MKKIIKLTENDLINLVKKIIKEQIVTPKPYVVIGGVTYKNKKLTTKRKVERFLEYSFPTDLGLDSIYLKHIKQTDVDSMLNYVARTGGDFKNSNGYTKLITYFKTPNDIISSPNIIIGTNSDISENILFNVYL